MELAQALESPLLGAHPSPPDAGLVKSYFLQSDFREYLRFENGEVAYRNPRYWHWKGYYNGRDDNYQWLRNTDGSPQSRQTAFIVPFQRARLAHFTWSSRNDGDSGSDFLVEIYRQLSTTAGDTNQNDELVTIIRSSDTEVTSFRNGRRMYADLRSLNIEVDRNYAYSARIYNETNTTEYRNVRVDLSIEELAVQP